MRALEELIYSQLRQLLHHLVSQDYDAVEEMTHGVRLTSEELRTAVADCPYPLVDIDGDVLRDLALQCTGRWNGATQSCWVDLDLMTASGPADLTLEMTLRWRSGRLQVEVDNLHTL